MKKKTQKEKKLTVQELEALGIVPRLPRPDLLGPFVQVPAARGQLFLKSHDGVVRPETGEAQLEQRQADGVGVEAVWPLEAPEDRGQDGREEGRGRLRGEAGHDVLLRRGEPVFVSVFFFRPQSEKKVRERIEREREKRKNRTKKERKFFFFLKTTHLGSSRLKFGE